MLHQKNLVTIIIPSFNQGRFIRETLESCLGQDYELIEILVIDGGSSDETLSVLKSIDAPNLHWWSEPDKGVVDAVNKGIACARGDILTIQSSDDVFIPGAVAAAIEVIQENPTIGFVYGDIEYIDIDSNVIGMDVQGEFDLASYLGRFMYVPQPGTFFTRAAMELIGTWREQYSYAADADYWMRIATHFPVKKMSRLVARYRYHPDQRDTQRMRIARDWVGSIRDLIASGALDARQCRYAKMGIHLAYYRYAPKPDWWMRTRALYAALIANPPALLDPRFPKRELLPGRDPIWALLSRIKHSLGFKPRVA
jgi:glycosyltransferase involved in cell wall biosynthesis